jgi:dihydroorotate dehydrogenase
VTYRRLVRPVLFRVGGGDAEAAHERTVRWLAALARRPVVTRALTRLLAPAPARPASTPARPASTPARPAREPASIEVFGLRFPNRVGLAAGLDKNGVAVAAWPALGFGFVEVGTVTWHAQPGNDRPRLFRLPASQAVINRMGFNNDGAAALAAQLAAGPACPVPLGVSLGKSKVTPVDEAVGDYVASLRALEPYGDYFAVNVSSPNTPGLRALQDRGHLTELLAALRAETAKPILVKIAPDLTDAAIADLLAVVEEQGVAGVIATNTTLGRGGLAPSDVLAGEQVGGLSGAPLRERAREVVGFVHRETGGRLPIIGVGGILRPDDALAMVDAGASLVQLYTGLIYGGPALVRGCVRALARSPVSAARKR